MPRNILTDDENSLDPRFEDLSWQAYRREILAALRDQAQKINSTASEVQRILTVSTKVELMCQNMVDLTGEVRSLTNQMTKLTIQMTKMEAQSGTKWNIMGAFAVAALTAFLTTLIPMLFK